MPFEALCRCTGFHLALGLVADTTVSNQKAEPLPWGGPYDRCDCHPKVAGESFVDAKRDEDLVARLNHSSQRSLFSSPVC
jgi:hypothetical protein